MPVTRSKRLEPSKEKRTTWEDKRHENKARKKPAKKPAAGKNRPSDIIPG